MKRICLLLLCLLLLSAVAMADSESADAIKLRGWNETDGYQYIEFGYYPYFSDGAYAPIVWRVLDVNRNVVLLQSVYALDAYMGNEYSDPTGIYEAFNAFTCRTTQFERSMLLFNSTLSAGDLCMERFGFPLSAGKCAARMVQPTPYAASKGLDMKNGCVAYWTYEGNRVRKVTAEGAVMPVNFTSNLAVVPTISIDQKELRMDKGAGTLEDPYASSADEISLWMEKNMFFDIEDRTEIKIRRLDNTLKTYTGPGTNYYREKTSQIGSRTTMVSIMGKEGRWYMIEYGYSNNAKQSNSNKKIYKTAWIHERDFDVNEKSAENALKNAKPLPEFRLPGKLIEETDLFDDFDMIRDPLYTLWEGQEISLLGYTHVSGQAMAYIETEIYDKPARGFVPLDRVELDEYEISGLINMIGQ